MNARDISVSVLSEVIRNKWHLDDVLARSLKEVKDKREIKLAQELCYGVMRWYEQLLFITNYLINKPVKEVQLKTVILTGLYQLKFLRVPDHAAISESVELTKRFDMAWAGNFVNAVLRRYQRDHELIDSEIKKSAVANYAHPEWMLNKFSMQWPDHWQDIVYSNNSYPPMHLRLNLSWKNKQDYSALLNEQGIAHISSDMAETVVSLVNPMDVEEIPGFSQGHVTVQDAAAQLAAPLMDLRPGQRILDACAAPGGKTGHILELAGEHCKLVAVEIDNRRAELLRNTLNRIHKQADIIIADITRTSDWWDGKLFDRILLDAPCSATGVIRRHPDIKYLRSPGQLQSFCDNQNKMLAALWPLLKPGGRLVYCTCSVFLEESDERIEAFINEYDDAELLPVHTNWGVISCFGRHTIPGHNDSDGFYYSVLTKPV
jgi:16S rRNA (cytosine967-C5)-methyltransferase